MGILLGVAFMIAVAACQSASEARRRRHAQHASLEHAQEYVPAGHGSAGMRRAAHIALPRAA